MSDNWTPLGELPDNTLFEMRDATHLFRVHDTVGGSVRCEAVGIRNADPSYLDPETLVRPIDLAFLLAVANDKLGEHEGYQCGLRDGARVMRERAAKVAESIDWPDHVTQTVTVCAMTADAIRTLPCP